MLSVCVSACVCVCVCVCSPGLFLSEDVGVDVCHEVSSGGVGHHEAHVVCSLEAAVQVHQERMSGGVDHLKDPLFTNETEHKQTEALCRDCHH